MMSNDEEIESLQSKLTGACEQKSVFVNRLKKTYLKSACPPEIVRFAMDHFDEEGEFLGFEKVVLDHIQETAEANLDEIVVVVRATVFHLLNDLSQVPVLK